MVETAGFDETAAHAAGEFDLLQAQARLAFEQGRTEEACELLLRAIEWAEERSDDRRADLAFCNHCAATIGSDDREPLPRTSIARLREILMRNTDDSNCRLAAYILGRAYELQKDPRKGLFYARIALDRSQLIGRADWLASSHNQIGNMLIAQSFFEQAAEEYEEALRLHPGEAAARRAVIEINLGYSELVRGLYHHGLERLYRCLRLLKKVGARREQMLAHVDLCYAHLELQRYREAMRHGRQGLALAEEFGDADATKNALYLLGQAAQMQGERLQAHGYFQRLQNDFFPGSPSIPELLMAVDVRKMINLRA